MPSTNLVQLSFGRIHKKGHGLPELFMLDVQGSGNKKGVAAMGVSFL